MMDEQREQYILQYALLVFVAVQRYYKTGISENCNYKNYQCENVKYQSFVCVCARACTNECAYISKRMSKLGN